MTTTLIIPVTSGPSGKVHYRTSLAGDLRTVCGQRIGPTWKVLSTTQFAPDQVCARCATAEIAAPAPEPEPPPQKPRGGWWVRAGLVQPKRHQADGRRPGHAIWPHPPFSCSTARRSAATFPARRARRRGASATGWSTSAGAKPNSGAKPYF
jgi:hypothetical protein